MGRMKELYMSIREANDGEFPDGLSQSDAFTMHKIGIFNWEEYLKFKKENHDKQALKKKEDSTN